MKKAYQLVNRNINERLQQLDKLTDTIAHFFSTTDTNRFWPILRNQRLTLLTDDPHFATQARFKQRNLCNYLSKSLNSKITKVDIKVISLPLASFEEKTNRFRISDNAAEIISSIALGMNDTELQNCLTRLAKTVKRPDNG